MKKLIVFTSIILTISFCHSARNNVYSKQILVDSVLKIEMNLNAFGVESDRFPSIQATIDFQKQYSICKATYDNPTFKDSTYSLTPIELKNLQNILQKSDLGQLKKAYNVSMSDQPTSTITITTNKKQYKIRDYGLHGENPLDTLYKIVYKLN